MVWILEEKCNHTLLKNLLDVFYTVYFIFPLDFTFVKKWDRFYLLQNLAIDSWFIN